MKIIKIISMVLILYSQFSYGYKVTSIIPEPNFYKINNGTYTINKNNLLYVSKGLENEKCLLKNFFKNNAYFLKETKRKKDANIFLELDKQTSLDRDGEYELTITNYMVKIRSKSPEGVFYGIQSLFQLIRNNKGELPCMFVNDYPAYEWRSFMLDEARHFKGKDEVKKILDVMAELKMNIFHWHLTDHQGWRIEIKKYPKLTEIGSYRDSTKIGEKIDKRPHYGYYTQDDIKEIINFASQRYITIVPEIDMPGHATAAIASYPEMGSSGVPVKVPCVFGPQLEVFDITKPYVINFLKNILNEIMELFPSKVIHIGGDEVRYNQWNESSDIKRYMKNNNIESPSELQLKFTNSMSNWLFQNNRRMMGWNEITGDKVHSYHKNTSSKDVIGKLSSNTLIHFWKGSPNLIVKAVRNGYDIVNSNHVFTYFNYKIPLSKAYSFNPTPDGISKSEAKHILGLGCQMWGEYIPTVLDLYNRIFPNIAAYAEIGWTTQPNKNYDRFYNSLQYIIPHWKKKGFTNFKVIK